MDTPSQSTNDPFFEDERRTRNTNIALLVVGAIACLVAYFVAPGILRNTDLPLAAKYFPSFTPTSTRTPTPTRTPIPTNTPTRTPAPTRTPTITPTSYLLLTPPGIVETFHDAFDTNTNRWKAYFSNNSAQVKDGRLSIRSNEAGYIAIARCDGCPDLGKAFYAQVDVVPEKKTKMRHGVSFCMSKTLDRYYTFLVDPDGSAVQLIKRTDDEWHNLTERIPTSALRNYPASNTVGVLYVLGKMSLYVNGMLATSFTDKDPFPCKWVGVVVDGGMLTVFADNFFAYKIPQEFIPTAAP